MLETQQAQLVSGLQELYRRVQSGEGWPGTPLKESKKGSPLTHEILDRLGSLKQDGHTDEYFEENLELLQRKLLADGAGFTRGMSFDTASDIDQSPIFEQVSHPKASHFSNPWTMNHLPPTPPTNSPRPSLVKSSSPLKSQIPTPVSQFSEESPIFLEPSELPEVMDFNMSYQAPIDFNNFQAMQRFYDPTRMVINPCLTMKDTWYQQDDSMTQYYHGSTFSWTLKAILNFMVVKQCIARMMSLARIFKVAREVVGACGLYFYFEPGNFHNCFGASSDCMFDTTIEDGISDGV